MYTHVYTCTHVNAVISALISNSMTLFMHLCADPTSNMFISGMTFNPGELYRLKALALNSLHEILTQISI